MESKHKVAIIIAIIGILGGGSATLISIDQSTNTSTETTINNEGDTILGVDKELIIDIGTEIAKNLEEEKP